MGKRIRQKILAWINRSRRKSLVVILSAIVVVFVTAMLISPASTLTEETAAEQGGIDLPAATQPAEDTEKDVKAAEDTEEATAGEATPSSEEVPSSDAETPSEAKVPPADTEESSAPQPLVWEKKDAAMTLGYKENAGIPEGAQLQVRELTGDEYEEYLTKTASAMEKAEFKYARIFDISIVDSDGRKIEPDANVDLDIQLKDADETKKFSVIHFAGKTEKPEKMKVRNDGNTVSFATDSFSAYAIVQGPSQLPAEWDRIDNMNEFREKVADGLYIGSRSGYYTTNVTAPGERDKATTGIVKTTPAHNWPVEEAA